MVKKSSDLKSIFRKKPEFVIARFSLYGHPRFKGYTRSPSNYVGWSKPIIDIVEIESLQIDQQIRFNGCTVQVVDWSEDSIVLQFERENSHIPGREINEQRILSLNVPMCTGSYSEMYDRTCDIYLCCWTSWEKFLKYYLGVKWERWKDDCKARIIDLPFHYSVKAIKQRWKMRWNQFKALTEELIDAVVHLF